MIRNSILLVLVGWLFGALLGTWAIIRGFQLLANPWIAGLLVIIAITTSLSLNLALAVKRAKDAGHFRGGDLLAPPRERDGRGRFRRSRVAEEAEAMAEVEEFLARETMEEEPELRRRHHRRP